MLDLLMSPLTRSGRFRGKLTLILALHRLITFPYWVSRFGVRIRVHPDDETTILAAFGYFDDVYHALEDISDAMNFVDVGAHHGIFAVAMARKIGAQGACFAFEPNPAAWPTLVKTVQKNKASNVRILPFAISDQLALMGLNVEPTHSGLAHLIARLDSETLVLAVKLDQTFETLSRLIVARPFYIKIDVEGHEPRTLQGLLPLLQSKNCRKVVVEMDRGNLTRSGAQPEDIYSIMQDCEFVGTADRNHGYYNEVFVRP